MDERVCVIEMSGKGRGRKIVIYDFEICIFYIILYFRLWNSLI